jgi:hypothetical protein
MNPSRSLSLIPFSRYVDDLSNGEVVQLESMKNPTCEYWVDPKYQVCLSESQLTKELDITWRGPSHVTGQHGLFILFTSSLTRP